LKREALIRELRKIARKRGLIFKVVETKGKGSHYRVYLGDKASTLQSGELTRFHTNRIKKQLGLI